MSIICWLSLIAVLSSSRTLNIVNFWITLLMSLLLSWSWCVSTLSNSSVKLKITTKEFSLSHQFIQRGQHYSLCEMGSFKECLYLRNLLGSENLTKKFSCKLLVLLLIQLCMVVLISCGILSWPLRITKCTVHGRSYENNRNRCLKIHHAHLANFGMDQ